MPEWTQKTVRGYHSQQKKRRGVRAVQEFRSKLQRWTRVGRPAQAKVRGAHGAGSRTAGSVFVSEPPLPHQSCGLVRGRCVRATQLARVRRRVNWCRAGESTKE